ncbi:hypothetical protein BKA80DRAFT_306577 [Phyllosticta citrichinensis]
MSSNKEQLRVWGVINQQVLDDIAKYARMIQDSGQRRDHEGATDAPPTEEGDDPRQGFEIGKQGLRNLFVDISQRTEEQPDKVIDQKYVKKLQHIYMHLQAGLADPAVRKDKDRSRRTMARFVLILSLMIGKNHADEILRNWVPPPKFKDVAPAKQVDKKEEEEKKPTWTEFKLLYSDDDEDEDEDGSYQQPGKLDNNVTDDPGTDGDRSDGNTTESDRKKEVQGVEEGGVSERIQRMAL